MSSAIIELSGVTKHFGGIRAVDDLSFSVSRGEVVGLIGPNGSGKSTTVNLLSGALPLTSGNIVLDGRSISSMAEPDRVAIGLARTFQTATYFPGFTVFEQVLLGCHTQAKTPAVSSIFRSRASQTDTDEQANRVREILAFTGLAGLETWPVETLSSAQQRLLMIATALAAGPKLIMLDEPAAGMIAAERKALGQLIATIKARGISVILIEHHMSLIMDVCDRIVVLNFGQKIAEGPPEQIRSNPDVIQAYLGVAH